MFPVSNLLYHQFIYLHHFHLSDFFHHISCCQSYILNLFHRIFVHILYISAGSQISQLHIHQFLFGDVIYNGRGTCEK